MWTPKISHVAAQNQWQWHEILVVLAKFRAWGDLKLLNDLGIFTKNIEDLMSWLDLMVLYIVKCFRLDEGLEKRDCISILGVWRVKIRVTYIEWTWFLKIKFTTWKEGNWDHATMCPSFDSTLGEYLFLIMEELQNCTCLCSWALWLLQISWGLQVSIANLQECKHVLVLWLCIVIAYNRWNWGYLYTHFAFTIYK